MKLKSLFLNLICVGFIAFSASSCKKSNSTKKRVKGDENWVDYVHDGTVQLGLDYTGRDFYTEGVGQFTLKTAIDGDTAHFTPLVDKTSQGTMKARFYGIDTPESTGKVQMWGKDASNFTKEKLYEANEHGTIVVSSPQTVYAAPSPDSTGSRYVSLVWINTEKKNAPLSELYLLNLWIVQEGLSWVKNVQDMPQYADTFYNAEQQAKDYQLCLFSDEIPETWNGGEYQDTSLLDMKEELKACLADPTRENKFDNARIRIQGTVSGFSNHILYLQDYVLYDNDDPSKGGEYCGINIFVGMQAINQKYRTLNTFIQVCGLAQYTDNYGFQVTDTQGHFPPGTSTSEVDAKIIYTPAQNEETEHNLVTMQYTASEMSAIASANDPYDLRCLNCHVEITEDLVCTKAFINTSSAQEITLTFGSNSFNCYIPFNYKGDPESDDRWVKESDFEGRTFRLKGVYVFHKTTTGKIKFQIIPNGSPDLVWVQD